MSQRVVERRREMSCAKKCKDGKNIVWMDEGKGCFLVNFTFNVLCQK